MPYSVSDDALTQCVCHDNFSCLSGVSACLGKAQSVTRGNLLVIDCFNTNPFCDYRKVQSVYGSVCECPVRLELFQRYGR